ncbi:MAG: dihydrolipoyl dehydrogenase [Elusimicrobia bacterium CG1_02_63_36]|nr:MAG: dihydrolipoyl dehydrogenase [Elusimicrobia bacterium CG1_02_63_36]PIP83277.1 MAG: dihydrolipoyl dehydrogenase [Elusimicrobia bacterium CG22_combo_CG10-13_8_21_14_all_63_91]PJA14933.1 MAG: dihydrolipoyl dehydrogenase [Elusimicrobia bacterium CG_4_10_14_0_2_um_filter_63_34]PJB26014.1 MAG: dihydrolipoyl dehydrogenase [Elusimicrobia bacterium CG_4_9_14_3_um_filter_62_55]
MEKTELVVLGGGPGGYAAAFYAADCGIRTSLVDIEPNPGGVCLYRGCIPSKALLHAAALLTEAEEAKSIGIQFSEPVVDLDKLREWKESVVRKLTGGLGQLSKQRKINYVQGRGRFLDASTLEVESADGSKRTLAFDHAILATGSRPVRLPFLPDSERVLDSTGALELRVVPKRMLVIGGGYIGLEMATVYAALGSEITVVEMTPGLLPGCDRDLANVLARRVSKTAKAVLLETKVVSASPAATGIKVEFEGKEGKTSAEFDVVLAAVGRRPNSENIGLENTKIQIDKRGFVTVDSQRRTGEPTIFAIGDIAGEPMLAHKASHEGRVAVDAIVGKKTVFEPVAIPAVVFTDPEVAWCGLTENEAAAQGRKIEVARFPWAASGRAITLNRTDGMTKLIVDPETERVLGVGIVGPGAGELIAEGTLAVEMGARASDVALTIHAHPTLSETLMESAEAFLGHSTHVYRPKKPAETAA